MRKRRVRVIQSGQIDLKLVRLVIGSGNLHRKGRKVLSRSFQVSPRKAK